MSPGALVDGQVTGARARRRHLHVWHLGAAQEPGLLLSRHVTQPCTCVPRGVVEIAHMRSTPSLDRDPLGGS